MMTEYTHTRTHESAHKHIPPHAYTRARKHTHVSGAYMHIYIRLQYGSQRGHGCTGMPAPVVVVVELITYRMPEPVLVVVVLITYTTSRQG